MTKEEFITYAKKYRLYNAIINLHLPYTFFSYDFLKEMTSQKTPNFLEKLALEENAECYLDLYGNYYPIHNIEDVLKINEFLGFLK